MRPPGPAFEALKRAIARAADVAKALATLRERTGRGIDPSVMTRAENIGTGNRFDAACSRAMQVGLTAGGRRLDRKAAS